MKKNNFFKKKKGFASLLTVIIIGAGTVVMAVGAAFLSMGELDMSTASVKGGSALVYAESCIEEGLRRIRMDTNYYATADAIDIGEGQCFLTISGSGSNRTVVGEGLIDDYRKNIEVSLTLSGSEITINQWEEKNN